MATSAGAASASQPPSRPGSLPDASAEVPVETLVEHLLAAKRALSSMSLVYQANQLMTHARHFHEETVILGAQTAFLRRAISEQVRILLKVRRGMAQAYDVGKKGFKALLVTLDKANGRLEQTMESLRETIVEAVFRPVGEEPRNLLDFVDEKSVDGMRKALKGSVDELQAAQTSFDGDLLRFDTDLRNLNKIMAAAPSSSSPSASQSHQSIPHLLDSLLNHSHDMAQNLTAINRHFDLCVTAVRTTEGGAALARRKAAEVTSQEDPVSISRELKEESDLSDLEPISAQERAEMLQIVLQDASQVEDVVAEMMAELQEMEADFGRVRERADEVRGAYDMTNEAFRMLEEIGSRLQSYIDAETEFQERWENEKVTVGEKLEEMEGLGLFYEGYASAYDTLILEVERRRSVDEKIQSVWRKAKESVDKLVDADRREREIFREEIGEYLPTDLWVGMSMPIRRWDLVPMQDSGEVGVGKLGESSTPTLDKSVVAAAKKRLAGGR